MTIHQTILAASMVAFGLLGQPALSQANAGDHPVAAGRDCGQSRFGVNGWGFERMEARLDLSTKQRQELKSIADKYRPEMRELVQLSFDNRNALDKMDASDPKLQELAEAQGKTIADLTVLRKKMRSQMEQVLTDAQRQQLQALYEHHRYHRGRHARMGHA